MKIEEVLTQKDLQKSVRNYLQKDEFEIIESSATRASTEVIGFIGEHYRINVRLLVDGKEMQLNLFVKTSPGCKSKADWIEEYHFFAKENLMYNGVLSECNGENEPSPWRVKTLHVTDTTVVMIDMRVRGFKAVDKRSCMDLEHCIIALTSIARYHANIITYESNRTEESGKPYELSKEYGLLEKPTNFCDCLWFRTGVKAVVDFMAQFSYKYNPKQSSWEQIVKELPEMFLEGCKRLDKSSKFRNVILHADLWANNMLFRYDEVNKPVDCLLLDFQCVRYGAYGADLASFLYLNTDKVLREENEKLLLRYYAKVLNEELSTQDLFEELDTVEENFEHCRIFGLIHAAMIFPYIIMNGSDARVFGNPETYVKLNDVDRSDVILSTANFDHIYRKRILDVAEEFVERFIIRN